MSFEGDGDPVRLVALVVGGLAVLLVSTFAGLLLTEPDAIGVILIPLFIAGPVAAAVGYYFFRVR